MDPARVHVRTRYIGPVKRGSTIPVGTTVTWVNDGSEVHTSTSKESSPDSVKWNSGILLSTAEFSFTFNQPGTFGYICDVHPFMTATITVTGP